MGPPGTRLMYTYIYICLYTRFSLKRGTAAPRRGVKPANKVGAVNYIKMYRVYDRTTVCFSHVFTIIVNVVRPYYVRTTRAA